MAFTWPRGVARSLLRKVGTGRLSPQAERMTSMGIFSRLADIVNSNINAILDRAQDPEKIIRLIIQEMEDTLVEVRSGAVRTIAERKELERRLETLRQEQQDWERRAEFAIPKGREDLAKGALLAKARVAQSI